MNAERLNYAFKMLARNPGMTVGCMYGDNWSFVGCAWAKSKSWLKTDEIRELWTGGMLEVIEDGILTEGDNKFKYGKFRFNPEYIPPAFLRDADKMPSWMDERSRHIWTTYHSS